MSTTEVIVRHETAELARVSLLAGEYVIGRGRDATIQADTPLISRRHARIVIQDGVVLVEDLASSNGTFVDGQPISEVTRLLPGQELRLGDVHVELVHLADEAPAGPVPLEQLVPGELLTGERYAVGQQVARGGMGAILQAEQAPMKRRVAMKVMLDTSDADDVVRFIAEAQITGQLEHPGIVPIYELGLDEQRQLFYTMKFVRGITLKKVIELIAQGVEATAKKFPLPALLTIFQKTCDAIAFAHSKGIIHRDLKPENIMLGDFGEVLVMDWGLAKPIGPAAQPEIAGIHRASLPRSSRPTGGSSYTLCGTILGTPQYMAPEQARGEVDTLDSRADIYALGAILFEILHLRAPFTGVDPWEIVERVKRGEIEWKQPVSAGSASSHTPGGRKLKAPPIPESLLAICRKALSMDREARYSRVDQLQEDISAYQHGFVTSAEKASWPKRVALAIRRNKTVSIAAAAVISAVLFFGTHATIQGRTARRALADLKRNAPDLLQLAETEASFRRFDRALEKIDGALAIDPALRPAYWQRAWSLIGLERWTEAATALHVAKQKDPANAARARVLPAIEAIAALPDRNTRFASVHMPVVMDHLDSIGVPGIRIHFGEYLGVEADKKLKLVQDRIKQWLGSSAGQVKVEMWGTMKWVVVRLGSSAEMDSLERIRGLPIDVLTFAGRSITSLEPLRGMPLRELECANTNITDLSPLKGMPLRRLIAGGTLISDIAPLKGMPIEYLELSNTLVTDATPLAGMPLKRLNWTSGQVTDLSALKGAPLEVLTIYNIQVADLSFLSGAPINRLEINGNRAVTDLRQLSGLPIVELNIDTCSNVKDLRPLLGLPALERLRTSARRADLAVLHTHPTLKFITLGGTQRPVAEFWAETETIAPGATGPQDRVRGVLDLSESAEVTTIDFVRGLPLKVLDLRRTKVSDLSPIAGMKSLRVLRIAGCQIDDYSPIKGLPLTELRIGTSKYADLSVLEGMPLVMLTIDNTPIEDVAPLAKLTSLRMLCVPRDAKNIEVLRTLPNLTHISYNFSTDREEPDMTAANFWSKFDAEKKAGSR